LHSRKRSFFYSKIWWPGGLPSLIHYRESGICFRAKEKGERKKEKGKSGKVKGKSEKDKKAVSY